MLRLLILCTQMSVLLGKGATQNDLPAGEKDEFGYDKTNGPSMWGLHFKTCNEHRQSPIALDTTSVVTQTHPHLYWWNYYMKPTKMTLINNGHTVKLLGNWDNPESNPYIWLSPGDTHYLFDHLHFHWGPDDSSGSEHTVNNQKYPLEMHIVHFKKDYGTISTAIKHPDGLMVVGVLFRISEHPSPGLNFLQQPLAEIHSKDMTEVEPFELANLIPLFQNHYLTYNGSLTTPPCSESVTWIVKKDPIPVTSQQVGNFRDLYDKTHKKIEKNYRPVQDLHQRKVIYIW